ncbi:putative F-box/kelch-repeat protein At1g15680 [Nicotiana tabacum]|uniref:Uncharacterized protein LOC104220637 n=1 Tax=Nicotiana sylvestris TaxID=4096 RepID=A0A1U7VPK3_NICSY|nr:PREDICTED: uncharacterized protein LOC104220637 [Nicotiana sylvestris]
MVDSKSRSRKLQVRRKKKSLFIFNNLTDELLNEVLIRLTSIKEAIRCKLVCKRWLSLISSDYFATTSSVHNRNNDKTTLPFTVVLYNRKNYVGYEEFLHGKGLSRRVELGFLNAGRPDDHLISLEASCGDLILFSGGSKYSVVNYCICNILTKQWIVLPPTLSTKGIFGESVGFLYEPLDNDDRRNKYLVLRFIPCDSRNLRFDVEIFSSDKGKWTKFVAMSPWILNNLSFKTPVIACGRMLYTLNYGISATRNCIVAFDPFTNDPDAQLLRVLDLPLKVHDILWSGNLGVCRGRLLFAQISLESIGCPCISVWKLEDYKTGEWTLVYKRVPTNKALRVLSLQS